jgi:glutamate carboxypeptidase
MNKIGLISGGTERLRISKEYRLIGRHQMKNSKEIGQEIQAYLQASHHEMIDFLTALVEAESPTTEPASQAVIQTILWEALANLGFEVELVLGTETGGYLLAQPGNGRYSPTQPSQLLLGHTDTVWPVGTLREMPISIEDNIMKGPGVYDMKAGLTQLIYALKAVNDLGLDTAVSPWVLINSDEEIGSPESRSIIMELAQKMNRALVMEPALGVVGKLKTTRKGVGRFEVVVTGRAAHAGLEPEKGISAILELSHVIQSLFALNEPENGVTVNVGIIEGGMQTNVIAPKSRAFVDVRVPTQADADRLQTAVCNLQPTIPGTTLSIFGGFNRPPLEPTPANRQLWQTAKTLGQHLGLAIAEGRAGGGSDGNLTSSFTATLDGLGAVGAGAHARHEFVYLDQMVARCSLLAMLLLSPAAQD